MLHLLPTFVFLELTLLPKFYTAWHCARRHGSVYAPLGPAYDASVRPYTSTLCRRRSGCETAAQHCQRMARRLLRHAVDCSCAFRDAAGTRRDRMHRVRAHSCTREYTYTYY